MKFFSEFKRAHFLGVEIVALATEPWVGNHIIPLGAVVLPYHVRQTDNEPRG